MQNTGYSTHSYAFMMIVVLLQFAKRKMVILDIFRLKIRGEANYEYEHLIVIP